MATVRYVIVPGIDDSDAEHWQSRWQARWGARASRIHVSSWTEPDRNDWVRAVGESVAAQPTQPCLLVAHSLGCLAVAHWLTSSSPADIRPVVGAVFVAPPDQYGPQFPAAARSFGDVQPGPVRVPALVLASDDDPYCTVSASRQLAAAWGATWLSVGSSGHLNSASGLGDWPTGHNLVSAFAAGAGVGRNIIEVTSVSVHDQEVVTLVEDLTDELARLGYTPEQTFGYDVARLAQSKVHLMAARVDDILVGIGGVELQGGDLAELRRFYVQPASRGTGAADAILDALVRYARDHGVRRLRLETGNRQRAAIAFYRRRGFHQIAPYPPYADSSTSICMERDLTDGKPV